MSAPDRRTSDSESSAGGSDDEFNWANRDPYGWADSEDPRIRRAQRGIEDIFDQRAAESFFERDTMLATHIRILRTRTQLRYTLPYI